MAHLVMRIADMPEVLAGMRAEIARLMREAAQDEEPRVAARLCEVAASFESGLTSVEDFYAEGRRAG